MAFANTSASTSCTGFGLSEFGQTVDGWSNLGRRLGATLTYASVLTSAAHPKAINPAVRNDEADDEFNDATLADQDDQNVGDCADDDTSSADIFSEYADEKATSDEDVEDKENQISRPELGGGMVAQSDDGHHQDITLEQKLSCLTVPIDVDSDKETSFNESSDDDPQVLSADDSTSLGTSSEAESNFHALPGSGAPPGLSLPPWKKRTTPKLISNDSDSAADSEPGCSKAPRAPPWKKSSGLNSSLVGRSSPSPSAIAMKLDSPKGPKTIAPWRKQSAVTPSGGEQFEMPMDMCDEPKQPPGLSLPPWKSAQWKQRRSQEAQMVFEKTDTIDLGSVTIKSPPWKREERSMKDE
jgi:hypothetical protein